MIDSSQVDLTDLNENAVAIDFGASNTDVAAVVDGKLYLWSERRRGMPSVENMHALLTAQGIALTELVRIAVTGGHHQLLPDVVAGIPVVKVGELLAIGRGGQALATGSLMLPEEALLVVSAGSGTAMVAARGQTFQHVTGTGMGGGTLLGLGKLVLSTIDPTEIDCLAQVGDPNGADLALRDVVSGPIGTLPSDATAVNFGRVARMEWSPSREDLAASLVNMVGQVIATLATNAARAATLQRGVVTGHLTDMLTMRTTMARVGTFFGFPLETCAEAGYATVIGALLRGVGR
jgi:type II pantothenate kinase